jgi:hypothetical protein
LEQAAKWAEHKLKAGAVDIIKGARSGTEEVDKGIKGIGSEISKLGKKIKPKKK